MTHHRSLFFSGFVGLVGCVQSSCIRTGTLIATPEGERPIETLRPGDVVWSFDPVSGERSRGVVIAVRSATRECVRIRTRGGNELVCTSEHPIASPENGRFEPAGRWVTGECTRLLVIGDCGVVEDTILEVEAYVGVSTVHDLTLTVDPRTFAAGGVIVHNKDYHPCPQGACTGPYTTSVTDTDSTTSDATTAGPTDTSATAGSDQSGSTEASGSTDTASTDTDTTSATGTTNNTDTTSTGTDSTSSETT